MKANKNITVILLTICVLSVMALIFYFSSQPADESSAISTMIARAIISRIMPDADITRYGSLLADIDHIVRKTAHFLIYSLLGINLCFLFNVAGDGKKPMLYSITIGLTYAVSDEFHQMFVPGRGAQWQDVLLDFCGVAAGGAAVLFLYACLRHLKHMKYVRQVAQPPDTSDDDAPQ